MRSIICNSCLNSLVCSAVVDGPEAALAELVVVMEVVCGMEKLFQAVGLPWICIPLACINTTYIINIGCRLIKLVYIIKLKSIKGMIPYLSVLFSDLPEMQEKHPAIVVLGFLSEVNFWVK